MGALESQLKFLANLGRSQRRILVLLGFHTPAVMQTLIRDRISLVRLWENAPGLYLDGIDLIYAGLRWYERELDRIEGKARLGLWNEADMRRIDALRPEIPWGPLLFLGPNPSPGNREEYAANAHERSRALRKLAEKRLVTREDGTGGRGKKRRTYRVRLTPTGARVAYSLIAASRDGDNSQANIVRHLEASDALQIT